ncbi:MAG TPA: hypothetical protein VFS25_06570 [Chitinophaga sp.]|uniref:hypothetical protein n=1 Tax=Chitinophaga sp. TaxID=1869181 RepID=UPI002DB6317C|nr:hypothetical protein [Chitinophaga sp.]HEU4552476.1 hypothetical protein [Chitinophaga sp.]
MKYLITGLLLMGIAAAKGQTPPDNNLLFNAFKQGNVNGGGNCASIALIKACIGTFGVGNVFTYRQNNVDSLITVTLRNDTTFTVTYAQIREATRQNGFVSKSALPEARRIRAYADTCFAVMVKMNQRLWNYPTYEKALSRLLNGYNTPSVNRLLGVTFRNIGAANLGAGQHLVTYNAYHAVYSSDGYYDETRSAAGYAPNDRFNNNRQGIKCWHYGCKPRAALKVF